MRTVAALSVAGAIAAAVPTAAAEAANAFRCAVVHATESGMTVGRVVVQAIEPVQAYCRARAHFKQTAPCGSRVEPPEAFAGLARLRCAALDEATAAAGPLDRRPPQ